MTVSNGRSKPGAYGSCKECNCGPCTKLVKCNTCCRCIPENICVILDGYSSTSCSCLCDAYTLPCSGGPTWSGLLDCTPLLIDTTFTIEEFDGECHLFLESNCLGLTGNNRLHVKIINCIQSMKCFDWTAVFTVNAEDCGEIGCDVIQLTVSSIEIVKNPYGAGCPACTGCTCLPKELCVSFTGAIIDNEADCVDMGSPVSWDGCKYSGTLYPRGNDNQACSDPVNIVIRPGKDFDTGRCTLSLELTGAIEATGNPVYIDGDCPEQLLAVWDVGDDTISASSNTCGDCPIDGCCGNGIPLVLSLTFVDVVNFSAIDGVEVTLTYDGLASPPGWYGSAALSGDCSSVDVGFYCDAVEKCLSSCHGWALDVSLTPGGANICNAAVEDTLTECDCTSPEFGFNLQGTLTEIDTCDCFDDPNTEATFNATLLV